MIIHSGNMASTIKSRQSSLESGQSSESDSSFETYDHLSYYISPVETSPENLAGEEVVSIRNEDIMCDAIYQKSGDTKSFHEDEVELAVFCLQAQESSQNLKTTPPRINGGIFSSESHKRKLSTSEDSEVKRRKTREESKVTVVYPIKSGIINVNGAAQNACQNITNGINGKAVYKCPTCSKTFESDKYLSMHLSLHKYPENPRETFDSSRQHIHHHHQQTQHETFNGDFKIVKSSKRLLPATEVRKGSTTTSAASGSSPAVSSSTNGQWVCPYCQKTFVQNSNFKNHVRTHSDERPFVCDICSIGFKERYHLKKHVLFKHTNDLKETCRICGKCFKDSTAVRAHERIHSELRPYGCTLCGKTFKTSECLWHHENRSKTCGKAILAKQQQNGCNLADLISSSQYTNVPLNVPPQKKPRRSKLSVSLEAKSQKDISETIISGHQLNAVLIDPSVCVEGSFVGIWTQLNEAGSSQFVTRPDVGESTKSSLKREKGLKDSDDSEHRPYKCKLCGNAFKLKVHLKKHHLYRHTNEYPCECSICGKRFKDTSAVRLHERIHSNDRPFKCTCGKSFKTRENLWGHKNRGPCESKVEDEASTQKGKVKPIRTQQLERVTAFQVDQNSDVMDLNLLRDNIGTKFNHQMPRVRVQKLPVSALASSKSIKTLENSLSQPSKTALRTATLKVIKTQQLENHPSSSVETCFSLNSSITIPTAVVAPMCRSQSNLNLKNVTLTTSLGQEVTLTPPLPKNVPSFSEEAKKCPTIQSLLMSKGNALVQATSSNNSNFNGLNSIKEPRVLKLYNPPTDTLAILIPTDSTHQFSMLDLNTSSFRANTKQEAQHMPTLNTLTMCDLLPDSSGVDNQSYLATSENDFGDIFDFQVGDLHDSSIINLKDVPSCGPIACNLEDLGQFVDPQSSGFDDMGVSGWSSDSSWFLGDDASFLDDVRLSEGAIFTQ